jgi:hypothetical protein
VSTPNARIVEDLLLFAAGLQSGTDVTPIRLFPKIIQLAPELSNVAMSQIIDDLAERSVGQIRPAFGDAGDREFLIDHRGVRWAQKITEDRRKKSVLEKLSLWNRTDWFALCAIIISVMSLVVAILALRKS